MLRTFLLISKSRIQEQTPQLSKQLDWTKDLPIHRQLGLAGTNRQLTDHNNQRMLGMASTIAGTPSQQADRYTVQVPALLPGVRCYVDASTVPDHPSLPPRMAGLGILFVNTQVQPAQTIYIKAIMSDAHSVIMAEAAALALAAMVADLLNFTNIAFLSDCNQLVQFLNADDQNHPPDWRIKPFT